MGCKHFYNIKPVYFHFRYAQSRGKTLLLCFHFRWTHSKRSKYQSEGACIKVNQEQMPLAIENERGVEICTMDLKQSIY